MIYTKQESDGYTKVAAGACQFQCKIPFMASLGVIHSDVAPAATAIPDFTYNGVGPFETLGTKDCYIKLLSSVAQSFSATEI